MAPFVYGWTNNCFELVSEVSSLSLLLLSLNMPINYFSYDTTLFNFSETVDNVLHRMGKNSSFRNDPEVHLGFNYFRKDTHQRYAAGS